MQIQMAVDRHEIRLDVRLPLIDFRLPQPLVLHRERDLLVDPGVQESLDRAAESDVRRGALSIQPGTLLIEEPLRVIESMQRCRVLVDLPLDLGAIPRRNRPKNEQRDDGDEQEPLMPAFTVQRPT
jgi:hypothetical protein